MPKLKFVRLALTVLLVSAFIAAVCCIAMYVTNFGHTVSPDSKDWAEFGEYVGGTLGSFFSLLAFGGVLVTIWFQANQMMLAKIQFDLQEIQRALAVAAERLDDLANAPMVTSAMNLPGEFQRVFGPHKQETFLHYLAAGGTAALSTPTEEWPQVALAQLIGANRGKILNAAPIFVAELDQLAWLIIRYTERRGSEVVVQFYSRRFGAMAVWLDALGLLHGVPNVPKVFDLRTIRAALTPAPE